MAFLRPETQTTNLVFKLVTKEPLVVVLPSDHRLASHEAINPQDIAGETFISVSNTAPVLRLVIDDYLRRSGVDIKPDHEVDHLAMAVSLVASTRGNQKTTVQIDGKDLYLGLNAYVYAEAKGAR